MVGWFARWLPSAASFALVTLGACGVGDDTAVDPDVRAGDGALVEVRAPVAITGGFEVASGDGAITLQVVEATATRVLTRPTGGPFAEASGAFTLDLISLDRTPEAFAGPPEPPRLSRPDLRCAPVVEGCDPRIEAKVEPGTSWWRGRLDGVEHGYDIDVRPAGEGPLRARLRVDGARVAVDPDGQGATFSAGAGRVRYDHLLAFDAEGATLPAHMEATARGLSLVVDDAGARYPITIDPVLSVGGWSLYLTTTPSGSFGESITSAGDVNLDGYDDVVVGAPTTNNGQSNEGTAWLFLGASGGVATAPAWSLEGNQAGALCGGSLAALGDTNNDGRADVAVGCTGWQDTLAGQGRVSVYLGTALGLSTAPTLTLLGSQASEGFGEIAALDANADARLDLAVGSPGWDNGETNEGRVQVYFGTPAGLSAAVGWTAESNIASAQLGATVARVGAVAGVGSGDHLIALAPGFSNGQSSEGRAQLYFGATAGLSTTPSWTFETNGASAQLSAAAPLGDVNGDGVEDFGLGALAYPVTSPVAEARGRAWVFHGSAAGIPTAAAWERTGAAQDALGSALLGYDWNDDGYSDLVLGSRDHGPANPGDVELFYGSATGLATTWVWSRAGQWNGSDRVGWTLAVVEHVDDVGGADLLVGAPGSNNGRVAGYTKVGTVGGEWPDTTAELQTIGLPLGGHATGVGDVNGDGYSDVAVINSGASVSSMSNNGTVNIFYGGAEGMTPTPQWYAYGPVSGAYMGENVAGNGDFNGDGHIDVAISAHAASTSLGSITGRVLLYLGTASGLATTPAATLEGSASGAYFGHGLDWAGDINADGYTDLIVGAPYHSNGLNYQGRVSVYMGNATADVAEDYAFLGGVLSTRVGYAVRGVGDVTGDGYADVAVDWNGHSVAGNLYGRVTLYQGGAFGLVTAPMTTIVGDQISGGFGDVIVEAGDVDGDAYADVLIGSPSWDNGTLYAAGRAQLFRGGPGGMATTPAFSIGGRISYENVGEAMAGLGDRDGDGFADVAVGRPGAQSGALLTGAVWVHNGSAAGLSMTPTLDYTPHDPAPSGNYADSVNAAGDTNGDGYADLVIGFSAFANTQAIEGAGLIYYGHPPLPSSAVDLMVDGAASGEDLGQDVRIVDDVDGDGFDDLLVTAAGADNGQTNEGRVELHLGSAAGPSAAADWTFETDQVGAGEGLRVASAGDVEDDGFGDVLISARRFSNGQSEEGRIWYFAGSATALAGSSWSMDGDQAGAHLGDVMISPGDVDADSDSEFIVAAPDWDVAGADHGKVWRFEGGLTGPAASPSWTHEGAAPGARLGASLASGDFNEDGFLDLALGAPGHSDGHAGEGQVLLFLGGSSTYATTPSWTWSPDVVGSGAGDELAAGDVDGDGDADLVIGSPMQPGGAALRLIVGSPSGPLSTPSWSWTGPVATSTGPRLAVSDIDGDSFADILHGAPDDGPGRLRIFRGASTLPSSWPSLVVAGDTGVGAPGDGLGVSLSADGDIDGDGRPDVVAGATQGALPAANEGRYRLWLTGSSTGGSGAAIRLLQPATLQTVGASHWTHSTGSIRVDGACGSPYGATRVRLQTETRSLGATFDGSNLWDGVPTPHFSVLAPLSMTVSALPTTGPLHVRSRVAYDRASAYPTSWGPWTWFGRPNEPQGVHVRAIDENVGPAAVPDFASVLEGDEIDIAVLNNDIDPDNLLLYSDVTIVDPPLYGTVTIEAGWLLYEHDGDENTQDSFAYSVCDEGSPSYCAQADVTITVEPTADPPVAVADNIVIFEGSGSYIDLFLNDVDPDSTLDASTLTVHQQPTHGTLNIVSDAALYAHDGSETTSDSFTYSLNDGTFQSNVVTVSITITPVNDPPLVVDDVHAVDEGSTSFIDVTDNDTDVESLTPTSTLEVIVPPLHGTAMPVGSQIEYVHDGSGATSDSLQYRVCDGGLPSECGNATVTITVDPVDDEPIASADAATVSEGAFVDVDVLANDSDEESTLSPAWVTITGPPAHGTLLPQGGLFRYQHDGSESLTDSATYSVCPAPSSCASATVNFTITPTNDAPAAEVDVGTVAEGGSILIPVLPNDTDVDSTLVGAGLSVVLDPVYGVATVEGASIRYTHGGTSTPGADSFIYSICDGGSPEGCASASVSISISAVDDPPVAVDDASTVAEGSSVDAALHTNDTDEDSVLAATGLSVVAQGQWGTASVVAGGLRYTHGGTEPAPDVVRYSICTVEGPCAEADWHITVTPTNDPPTVFLDPAPSIPEGTSALFFAQGADSDGDVITFAWDCDGDGVFEVSGGTSQSCSFDDEGTAQVAVRANDPSGASATAAIGVDVVNVAPAFVPVTVTTTIFFTQTWTLDVAATDPGADTLVISAPTVPLGMTLFQGQLTWTPEVDDIAASPHPVLLVVSDGDGGEDTLSFTLEVLPEDGDGDFDPDYLDCAPDDPFVGHGLSELACNSIDDDCDPFTDDGVDQDGDGADGCAADCDDLDPLRSPFFTEQSCDGIDGDCDAATLDTYDLDADGFDLCVDCNDIEPLHFPGAPEACDGEDSDCDPATGELGDGDGDGLSTCEGDCDDADGDRAPGLPELCNGLDDDCDPLSDELTDVDGDGSSSCEGDCDDLEVSLAPGQPEGCDGLDTDCDGAPATEELDVDGDGVATCEGDCDDAAPEVGPGFAEICDGLDQDCDGQAGPPAEDDPDGDGLSACEGDCGPSDPSVHPSFAEVCDGLDTDCDGTATPQEDDADGDGFTGCLGDCDDGDPETWPSAPEPVTSAIDLNCDGLLGDTDLDGDGWSVGQGDCFDTLASIHPEAEELCDGYDTDCAGGPLPEETLDRDLDGAVDCLDCADLDPGVRPGAPERCNGIDDDCDFAPAPDGEFDIDADGLMACAGDCDDADERVRLGFAEDCDDGVDNDCDGTVDVNTDHDHDDVASCAGDCRDTDDETYPDAPEQCDAIDNDCDQLVDEDFDGDGDGQSTCAGDCDDNEPTVYRLAPPVCDDALDNDCLPSTLEFEDLDGDGSAGCDVPGDCWEGNVLVGPGREEDCNGVDDDCDGSVDEGWDGDGDGFRPCAFDCDDVDAAIAPGEEEICFDDVDQDCDGEADEGCDEGDDDDGDDDDSARESPDPVEPAAGCQCATAADAGPLWPALSFGAALWLRRRRTLLTPPPSRSI